MRALKVLVTIAAALLIVGAVGCALGGIWTDSVGQVDAISWHLWLTFLVLAVLAIPATALAALLWSENT